MDKNNFFLKALRKTTDTNIALLPTQPLPFDGGFPYWDSAIYVTSRGGCAEPNQPSAFVFN